MQTATRPSCALSYKPDWADAQARWGAFWDHANTDRPLLCLGAPRLPTRPLPAWINAASPEERWMGADFNLQLMLHTVEKRWFGGESPPTGGFFTGGYALGCGPEVVFDWSTVWHPVTMRSIHDPLGYDPGPHDPWTIKLAAVASRLVEAAKGRFLVGQICQVMANDLLYSIRGGQDFLFDMAGDQDACLRRLDEAIGRWCDSFNYFRSIIETPESGCTWGWPGLWRDRYFTITQSDLSCMISPAMFRDLVVRELDELNDRGMEPIWYHVDGPKAYRHVAALLKLPYMRVLQFVPGAGAEPNGPAWIGNFRQVQAAGRGLDLQCPWEHLEYLVRHLRPEGLVLRSEAPSEAAGQEFIDNAARWAGSHVHS